MSVNRKLSFLTFRSLQTLAFLVYALTPFVSYAHDRTAIPLTAGETWRDPGAERGASSCFVVTQAAAGALVLELAVPATAPGVRFDVPAIAFSSHLRHGASHHGSSRHRTSHHGATHLVLTGAPTDHRVCVTAEDPRQPLPPFRLHTRFAAVSEVGMEKSETDGELEVEPDPLVSVPLFPSAECGGSNSETDGELEVEPDPLWADPLLPASGAAAHDLAAVTTLLAPWRDELCGQGEVDDHGDGFFCATALGWDGARYGEIDNGWGDDGDMFRFHLGTLTTVEIRALGEVELVGELISGAGQRLGVAVGDSFETRLVRTLVPGTYFVRVAGRNGASGSYSLAINSLTGQR